MRPLIITAVLLFVTAQSYAQQFSAGLRIGASYWPESTKNIDIIEGNSGFAWEKGAYARYETRKRLALELNISYCGFRYQHVKPNWDYFEAPPYEFLAHRSTMSVVTGGAMAQIRVTNNNSALRSYFGAGVSYGRAAENHIVTIQHHGSGEIEEREEPYAYSVLYLGVNNYTACSINKHLNIHSTVSFDVEPGSIFSQFPMPQQTDFRFAWTLGFGYTF